MQGRCVDLQAHINEEFSMELHERTIAKYGFVRLFFTNFVNRGYLCLYMFDFSGLKGFRFKRSVIGYAV